MAKQYSYFLCVENRGYAASLELRKVYRVITDSEAEETGLLRVLDESGEDYLYPASYFVAIDLPRTAMKAFSKSPV